MSRVEVWAAGALWVSLGVGLAGCGGGGETTTTTTTSVRETGSERPVEHEDGAQITGLMGTIRQEQVRDTLEPRMDQLMRCFEQRLGAVEFLGGELTMSFHIHTDGTVAWVYPSESTIGDREVERCACDVARRAHFPRPRGGEAEFSWGFALDPPSDVRTPVTLGASVADSLVGQRGADVRTSCGAGPYHVTAYVAPGGSVLAVGAAVTSNEDGANLDCVTEAVRAWTFPSPGSYAGKVSFTI